MSPSAMQEEQASLEQSYQELDVSPFSDCIRIFELTASRTPSGKRPRTTNVTEETTSR